MPLRVPDVEGVFLRLGALPPGRPSGGAQLEGGRERGVEEGFAGMARAWVAEQRGSERGGPV